MSCLLWISVRGPPCGTWPAAYIHITRCVPDHGSPRENPASPGQVLVSIGEISRPSGGLPGFGGPGGKTTCNLRHQLECPRPRLTAVLASFRPAPSRDHCRVQPLIGHTWPFGKVRESLLLQHTVVGNGSRAGIQIRQRSDRNAQDCRRSWQVAPGIPGHLDDAARWRDSECLHGGQSQNPLDLSPNPARQPLKAAPRVAK